MDKDLVSIIIPVYNSEIYLERLFNSLAGQTYTECEFIFVNDGSTDDSEKMILRFQKENGKVVYFSQPNGGISSARNLGLRKAKGKYIAFVDSDDYVLPEFVEEMVKQIEVTGADLVTTGVAVEINGVITEREHITENVIKRQKEFMRDIFLKINAAYVVWNKLFRKSTLDDFQFPEGYMFEDMYATSMTALKVDRVAYISQDLYVYCIREKSVFTTGNDHQFTDFAYLATNIIHTYIDNKWHRGLEDEMIHYVNAAKERMRRVYNRSNPELVTYKAFADSIKMMDCLECELLKVKDISKK